MAYGNYLGTIQVALSSFAGLSLQVPAFNQFRNSPYVRFQTSRSRPTFGWSPIQVQRGSLEAGPYHRGSWGLPGSYRKPMGAGGASVSTVRAACQASASADVTAVTNCSLSTPSFFGHSPCSASASLAAQAPVRPVWRTSSWRRQRTAPPTSAGLTFP